MKIVSTTDLDQVPSIHNPEVNKHEILHAGDVPYIDKVGQVIFAPGQIIPIHTHPDIHEIFFIRSGNGVIRCNGEERHVSEGTCIVVEPDEAHEVENTGSDTMLLIYIKMDAVNSGNRLNAS